MPGTYATPHADPGRILPLNENDFWFGAPLHLWVDPRRTKNGEEFDRQRKRIYDAEETVFGLGRESCVMDPVDFVTIIEAREDFQRVYGRGWEFTIEEVKDDKAPATGHHDGIRKGTLCLPKWSWNPYTVLHEMAHAITPHPVVHGPLFAFVYLDLLGLLGLDAELEKEFERRNVRTQPFRSGN